MRNESFSDLSQETRESKIVSAIYKRLNTSINKSVLTPIVKNLDLDRQVEIQVVSREEMLKHCSMEQYVNLDKNGNTLFIQNVYAKCLYGVAKIGSLQSVTRDEVRELYLCETPVISKYPLFISQTNEKLEVVDGTLRISFFNVLVICL